MIQSIFYISIQLQLTLSVSDKIKKIIMIIWKGKGILIFLYLITTVIVLAILNRMLIELFGIETVSMEVYGGLVFIVSAFGQS